MGDKLFQNSKLCWRQPHLRARKSHDMPRQIDLEVSKLFYAPVGGITSHWVRRNTARTRASSSSTPNGLVR